jgi:L-asparagine transporter-like permease
MARERDWNFTMNSEAASAHFFHLASPPRSPITSPILPISQNAPSSAASHSGVNNSPAYNAAIIPTLGIRVLSTLLAFYAVLNLILEGSGDASFIMAEILLILQSMWNILMIARYYLRDSQRRHGNKTNEKKIRFVDMGLVVGLVLSLSMVYLILRGIKKGSSDWNRLWGWFLVWIVV